jgi:uncharacterized protein YraI
MKRIFTKHLSAMMGAALLLCASFPATLMAAYGYSDVPLLIYAGPSIEYPAVARVGRGVPVTLYGCLPAWDWCDVSWAGNRGWIPADYIHGYYNNQNVPIVDYGVRVNLPLLIFNERSYWDTHYYDRPFYSRHIFWNNRSIRDHRTFRQGREGRYDGRHPQFNR